ncbi:DNA topoisomerase 6 subunit A [Ooceraea biroi]|uniref:DNA topoisomerase 6 subunit A n=1 Tax=Ooceraea biroi TaxID=2015173 RepID=UPI000F089C0F|nr:DNA topoisomerase 6 subunit A [Ooceraea biroi]
MSKANKLFQQQELASIANKSRVQEKRIDIPIVDNKEFRCNIFSTACRIYILLLQACIELNTYKFICIQHVINLVLHVISRMDLISRIENVTLKIIEQLSTGRPPRISYSSKQSVTVESSLPQENVYPGYSQSTDTERDTMSFDSSSDTMSFNSPSDFDEEQDTDEEDDTQCSGETTVDFARKRSRNKFTLMAMIMAEAHYLLLTNTTKTRRSFYYDLKNETTEYLVPNQIYVDRALNSVANLLECAPWNLQLLATNKGLVAGNITITLVDSQVINCSIPEGVEIPQIISNVTSISVKANFVLVIEKDAAFQKLLQENCPRVLNCILVTGKGYPDVSTRMLVKMLSEKMDLPIYIVVDADPFGVEIMLIYR